jgi:hypothetical protein
MHGNQAHFRAIPDENENKRQLEHIGIQLVGHADQRGHIERRARIAQDPHRGVIGEHHAEEREGDPHRTEDQIFPTGFEGFPPAEKGDQEGRRKSGPLQGHPLHAETVRHRRGDHRKQEHMEEEKK